MDSITFTSGGKEYQLPNLTQRPAALDKFLAWCETKTTHPLEAIKEQFANCSDEMKQLLVKEALAASRCKLTWQCPEVQSLLASGEGVRVFVWHLLADFHPAITEAEAWEIY